MRDLVGNTIKEGDLLFWRTTGLVVKVTNVSEPTLSVVTRGNRPLPPTLVIEATLPIDMTDVREGREPRVADFVRVVNPKSEELLSGLKN